MGVGKLSIGTATDRIYLIGAEGWSVVGWTPQAGDHAGSFSESALADYRAMRSYRDVTTIDTWTLTLSTGSQDATIRATQNLRRMLRRAVDYWATDWQGEVVYVEAQADCETYSRYTVVHDGRLTEDRNPFATPFMGNQSTMETLSLVVEHGAWLENVPGTGTCVELSSVSEVNTSETTLSDTPGQSTDDIWRTWPGMAYAWVDTILYIGITGGQTYTDGIRFVTVSVPNGATITRAWITFVAAGADATAASAKIYIAESDDAATFASGLDFDMRPWSVGFVDWPSPIEPWVLASSYNTPDVTALVQLVVDRPGWVANNDMAFKFNGSGGPGGCRRAASWDNVTYTEPVLHIIYGSATSITYGRSATCNNEVFVANKNNKANITGVFRRTNAGVWSLNLINTFTYNLLPNPVGNGDAVYFCCDTTLTDSGPFCSLVFDIGTAAAYAGAATLSWQYWNGAWVALTVVDDTTPTNNPFDHTGVASVQFAQATDWATTNPGSGMTGYYVKCIATIGGGDSITVPTQVNRNVYTATNSSVLIDSAQVKGDLPALLRSFVRNPAISCGTSAYIELLQTNRLIVGLRSTDRDGSSDHPFVASINLVNNSTNRDQNDSGVSVSGWVAAPATMTCPVAPDTPCGYWLYFVPGGIIDQQAIWVTMSSATSSLPTSYIGKFHAYIRCKVKTGGLAGDFGLYLKIGQYPGEMLGEATYSETAYNKHAGIIELLDLGQITLPTFAIADRQTLQSLAIGIHIITTRVAPAPPELGFIDLVLIPVDEWAGEFIWLDDGMVCASAYDYTQLIGGDALDIDGIGSAKKILATTKGEIYWQHDPINSFPAYQYRIIANGWPVLKANKSQRLWFLATGPHWDTQILYSNADYNKLHAPRLFRNARYFSMRGNG
jgi:hypothetical protein